MASDKTPRDLLTESFKNFYITIKEKFAAIGHTHAISDVTDLQSTLNGKAASSHTHTIGGVDGLQTALNGKAASNHNHDGTYQKAGSYAAQNHIHNFLGYNNQSDWTVTMATKCFIPNLSKVFACGTVNNSWASLFCDNAKIENGKLTEGSDRNLKKNINTLKDIKKIFMNLRPVSYQWKSDTTNEHHVGFIAQEVEETLNNNGINSDEYSIVSKDKLDEPDEFGNTEIYSLCYTEFIPIITQVLQDTVKEVESLKSEIADLKSQLSSLTSNE